jgi:[methyl-Co(III) methanol-specific corrinoid protein]:coenzyme M methyltransferase
MRRDVPVIVHCCELSPRAWPLLPAIGASAWSVGHATSVQGLLAAHPDLLVLGNVSTTLLHRGSPDDVARHAARARLAGVAAVAPACGLAMGTPIASVRALASSVLAPPERIPTAADAAVRGTTEVAP